MSGLTIDRVKNSSKIERLYLKEKYGINCEMLTEDFNFSKDKGYFIKEGDDLREYSNVISKMMDKFNVGKGLSNVKWSDRAKKGIQKGLRNLFSDVTNEPTDASPLKTYDILQRRVADKYSAGDVAVVARTESAKVRAVTQLLQWKKAGIKEVKYVAKPGARKSHQALNGKVYKIEELLNDEDKRIPVTINGVFEGYNCRCFYDIHLPGF